MKDVTYTDLKLMTGLRWFAWIQATIVSLLINLWFISQFATHFLEKIIFGVIALILESGKVTALLRSNIFKAMNSKIPNKTLSKKAKSSMVVYVIYAVFAVFCGVAFSINMTSTKIGNYDQNISQLEEHLIEITELEKPLVKPKPRQIWVEARDKMDQIRVTYIDIESKVLSEGAYWYKGSLYRYKWINGKKKTLISDDLWSKYQSILSEKEQSEQLFQEYDQEYKKELEDFDNKEKERKQKLQNTQATYGSALSIKTEIQQEQINKSLNAGSQAVFILFENMFGISANMFRLIVLIFLCILIEYIVYSLSPTSKINRRLLYDYREYIDKKVNIEKLLNEFDKELDLFLGEQPIKKVEEPKIKVDVGRIVPPENMKEDMNKLYQPVFLNVDEGPVPDLNPDIVKVEKEIKDVKQKSIPRKSKTRGGEGPKVEAPKDSKKEKKPKIKEKEYIYRFGKTTEFVAEKFKRFIGQLIKENGLTRDPEEVAEEQSINKKTLSTFMDRLSRLTYDGKPLLEKKEDKWWANYSSEFIVKYVLEKKSAN